MLKNNINILLLLTNSKKLPTNTVCNVICSTLEQTYARKQSFSFKKFWDWPQRIFYCVVFFWYFFYFTFYFIVFSGLLFYYYIFIRHVGLFGSKNIRLPLLFYALVGLSNITSLRFFYFFLAFIFEFLVL